MTRFILDTRITEEPCQWLYILFWKVMILQERKYVGQLMKTILEKNRNRDKNVNPKGVTGITL